MAVDLASLLAGQQMTVNLPQLQQGTMPPVAPDPFVWGQGGRRVTPDEIARQRLIAEQQTAGDYSPVGHWTQGLGRVLDGLEGGFAKRNLRRAEEANAAESNAVLEALLSGERDEASLLRAAANQYITPELRGMAGGMMPQAAKPEVLRANNGDIVGVDPATGQVLYNIADPNPKPVVDWIQVTDPATGVMSIVPVGPNGPIMGGGGQGISPSAGAASPLPAAPVGRLTPITEGGPALNPQGSFRGY